MLCLSYYVLLCGLSRLVWYCSFLCDYMMWIMSAYHVLLLILVYIVLMVSLPQRSQNFNHRGPCNWNFVVCLVYDNLFIAFNPK